VRINELSQSNSLNLELTISVNSVKIVNMTSEEPNSIQSAGTTRRDEIVVAATPVFLRFGFKKTSMEAVAAAAGISRQALYLHFPNKESMFSAVVDGLGQLTGRVAHIALWRSGLTLDQQLLAVFDETMPHESAELLDELLVTAKELVPDSVAEIDVQMVTEISTRLHVALVNMEWAVPGVSVEEAAQVLHATSYGLKQQTDNRIDYLGGMKSAISLVLKAGGLVPPTIHHENKEQEK
jgi:AcrR family transcriptional regulator